MVFGARRAGLSISKTADLLRQVHQNWTIEDWKNVAWSDESQFLLRHSDGRVRNLAYKEHEIMNLSFLVSMVQAGAGGVMMWGIFSWYTLGILVPIEHRLNTTDYPSIVAAHVHPFMTMCTHLLWLLPAG